MKSLTKEPPEWDKLPCQHCGGKVVYAPNSNIYHGKSYGNGMCYYCTKCFSMCGVHSKPNDYATPSRRPLGLLATKTMRQKKMKCHELFDTVWRNKKLCKRQMCYKKLATRMGIPKKQCHFGWFNEARLDQALDVLKDHDWYK